MALPVPAEVDALLVQAGVPTGTYSTATLQRAIDAAVATLESETGYHPFFPATATVTVATDGGGAPVRLPSALLSATSVLLDGVPFDVLPVVGPQSWLRVRIGTVGLISLTGTFGFASTIPADVIDALQRMAAGIALSAKRETLLADGLESWEEAGVRETRGHAAIREIGVGWIGAPGDSPTGAYAVFARYRRTDLL